MRRFFIHVLARGKLAHDDEGQQFPDLQSACDYARHSARRFIGQEILAECDPRKVDYCIHDETGDLLAILPFSVTMIGFDKNR